MCNVLSVRDRVIRVREWATAKAQAQMSTFSCPGWPLPRLPTLSWISPHRCKYVNMLTWKDVLFSSDLVALLERSKTAERRENSSSAPYKGLLWASFSSLSTPLGHYTTGGTHTGTLTFNTKYTRSHKHTHTHYLVRCGVLGVRFKRTPWLVYTLFCS